MLKKFYYDGEDDRVVSIGTLATEYTELVECGGTEQNSFEDYVRACQERNGGTLSDIYEYYKTNILSKQEAEEDAVETLRWFIEEYDKYGGITERQRHRFIVEIIERMG